MRRTLVFMISLMAMSAAMMVFPTSAGAADCADVTLSSGFRLLAQSAPVTGSYSVTVPAGEYRVVATSFDEHHADVPPPVQVNEVWYFTTDSGYTSPLSPDLPDDIVSMSFELGVLTVPDISQIVFWHGSAGPGEQSVVPTVHFLCLDEPDPTTTTQAPTTVPATTVPPTTVPATTVPPTTVPATTVPVTTVPVTAPTATTVPATPTTAAPTTAPTPTEPPGSVLPAPSIVNPEPTTSAPGEVAPIVITPEQPGGGDLARTGGGLVLLWVALLMFAGGLCLVVASRLPRPAEQQG